MGPVARVLRGAGAGEQLIGRDVTVVQQPEAELLELLVGELAALPRR